MIIFLVILFMYLLFLAYDATINIDANIKREAEKCREQWEKKLKASLKKIPGTNFPHV